MQKYLVILMMALFTTTISANPFHFFKGKTLAEELTGTWKIRNVQKMQGMVIRTKKYTKDGGDPKAYIKRFKGCTITFNADSTVVLVTANGKRTIEGRWEFLDDTRYRVKTGTNAPDWDNGHTKNVLMLSIKFPTARSYNIEGDFRDSQFGLVKVKGLFAIVDPKYMFKFEQEDGQEDKDGK